MGLYQTKKLLHNKGNHQQSEKMTTEWKKTFANHTFYKRIISKMYKELI